MNFTVQEDSKANGWSYVIQENKQNFKPNEPNEEICIYMYNTYN